MSEDKIVEVMARAACDRAHSEANDEGREWWWRQANALYKGEARTTLSALTSAGYVVVPKEPTEAMVNAIRPLPENWIGHGSARPETIERWQIGSVNAAVKFYRAMIAAAKEDGK